MYVASSNISKFCKGYGHVDHILMFCMYLCSKQPMGLSLARVMVIWTINDRCVLYIQVQNNMSIRS